MCAAFAWNIGQLPVLGIFHDADRKGPRSWREEGFVDGDDLYLASEAVQAGYAPFYDGSSTGAADDIKKATELARRMVTEFGMSEKLGVVRYATPQYQFLESYETAAVASPETLKLIDEEVQRILDEQFKRVINLLNENRDALESLTKLLLEKETISGEEVKEAIAKQRIKEPAIV